jgi:hypothetical protein
VAEQPGALCDDCHVLKSAWEDARRYEGQAVAAHSSLMGVGEPAEIARAEAQVARTLGDVLLAWRKLMEHRRVAHGAPVTGP